MRSELLLPLLLATVITGCGDRESAGATASSGSGGAGGSTNGCESQPANRTVTDIAIGDEVGYARLSDGTVWCWSELPSPLCPNGRYVPTKMATPACAAGVGLGRLGGARVEGLSAPWFPYPPGAPTAEEGDAPEWLEVIGELAVWGGPKGTFWWGDDYTLPAPPLEPSPFPFEADHVFPGLGHQCFTRSGGLYCFGTNDEGQLGDGSIELEYGRFIEEPVRVRVGAPIVHAQPDAKRTYAMDELGQLWAWGYDYPGDDGEPSGPLPQRFEGLPPLCGSRIGYSAGCGWTCDGEVYCWGYNPMRIIDEERGGSGGWRIVRMTDLEPANEVDIGGHSPLCAIKADGTLWCRGVYGRGTTEYPDDATATQVFFKESP